MTALLAGSPDTATPNYTPTCTHAVTDAMRGSPAPSLESGQCGSLEQECEKALSFLREAFNEAG